jgi:hypothetical protein
MTCHAMLCYMIYDTKLDISWNKIKSEGSTYIFDALLCNTSLLALDISWNGAGGHYEVCDESDRVDRISKIGAVESPKKTSTTYTKYVSIYILY